MKNIKEPHITFHGKNGGSISFCYKNESDLFETLRKLHIPLDKFVESPNEKSKANF